MPPATSDPDIDARRDDLPQLADLDQHLITRGFPAQDSARSTQ